MKIISIVLAFSFYGSLILSMASFETDNYVDSFFIRHTSSRKVLGVKNEKATDGASLVPYDENLIKPDHLLFIYRTGFIYTLLPDGPYVLAPCGKDKSTPFVGLFRPDYSSPQRFIWKIKNKQLISPWANRQVLTYKGSENKFELSSSELSQETEFEIEYYVNSLFLIANINSPLDGALLGVSCKADNAVFIRSPVLEIRNFFFKTPLGNVIRSAYNGKVLSQKDSSPEPKTSPLILTPFDEKKSLGWIIDPRRIRFEQNRRVITQPTPGTIGEPATAKRPDSSVEQRWYKIPIRKATPKYFKELRDEQINEQPSFCPDDEKECSCIPEFEVPTVCTPRSPSVTTKRVVVHDNGQEPVQQCGSKNVFVVPTLPSQDQTCSAG